MSKLNEELIKRLVEKRDILINKRQYIIGRKAENLIKFAEKIKTDFKIKHHRDLSKQLGECVISIDKSEYVGSIKFKMSVTQNSKQVIMQGDCELEDDFGDMIWHLIRELNETGSVEVKLDFYNTDEKINEDPNKEICSLCEKSIMEDAIKSEVFDGKTFCSKCMNKIMPLKMFLENESPKHALLFKTEGTVEVIRPKDEHFILEEIQKCVNGLIQIYPTPYKEKLIVCNQEGLLKRLPINTWFEKLFQIKLIGDILLCPQAIFERPE
ncbi:MAG: DUF3846 domain-containing protein [Erysipelotrichales bacterium]|nr:DUF3846 domain-containing protein [Erysipelotrichales bacterium]